MIKSFFSHAAALISVSIEQKGKPRIFRRDQWFIGRRLMKTHGGEIEIGEIVVGAINRKQAIKRLATTERIMCDSQPKLFRLSRQIPFRCQTCQADFALRVLLAGTLGIVPESDSTGDKVKQKGLSKKDDRYLRSLLVNGAMAIVRQAQRPGQTSLGREAARPHVGQADGDRDRQ